MIRENGMSEKYEVAFADPGGELCACDWRWPKDHPVWTMSSREGVQWYDDGSLTEKGRRALLEHFGLTDIAETLSLEVIRETPPLRLVGLRRTLENTHSLPRKTCVSTSIGEYLFAEQAA